MRRAIEIIPSQHITPPERKQIDAAIKRLTDLDGMGCAVFADAQLPPMLPADLIEGPARLYAIMVVGQSYTIDDLTDQTGLGKSTCHRFASTLVGREIVHIIRKSRGKGRPINQYQLTTHQGEDTCQNPSHQKM